MKILLMPSAFWPHKGGVEELTLKLAQHLLRRGHTVTVLTNLWPLDLPVTEVVDGVQVRRLRWTLPARNPASRIDHTRRSKGLVAEVARIAGAFDIVHVQCASNQTFYARRGARAAGRPLIVTTQGETVMDAGRIYQRSGWLRRELTSAAGEAVTLTACSDWTARVTSSVASRFADAEVVYNGVDADDWITVDPPAAPSLVAWGRHVPQKGFDLLLAAFAELRRRIPEAALVLGGDGPERERLETLAGPGVSFAGALDREGVRALLESARVAVVPSRIEPFGIVALEALAAGRGLVYSTRGGLSEAADTCGRGVDPFDTTSFAAALQAEIEQPTSSVAGRRRANEMSWEAVGAQYEAIYGRAVAIRSGARGG